MQLLQYPLVGLATSLIVSLTAQSGVAFTITPSQPGARYFYRYSQPYGFPGGGRGFTQLKAWPWYDPRSILEAGKVTELPRGGTSGLTDRLTTAFPNWTFTTATVDLSGSFDIEYYYPCGTQTQCGTGIIPPETGGVGAYFQITYYPGPNDPTGDQVHWIQRVISNYGPTGEVPFDNIDVPTGARRPYYDSYYAAGPDYFIDRPYNGFPDLNHYFFAELYLVEQTAPRTVTIYNGVRWGWKNRVTNPGGGSGGGGVQSVLGTSIAERELPILDIDSSDTSQLPQAVPESDSALGILAIGRWFGATWFSKRKKSSASLTDKPQIK